MKISLNWLKEYIPLQGDAATIAAILTDIGLEVEKYETVENIKGGLQGLVIGEVKSKAKHPERFEQAPPSTAIRAVVRWTRAVEYRR